MTLYETMREIAKKHNLPEHQNENFAHLEEQMLSWAKTLYDNNATELGIILLAFAMDLHHCRMKVIYSLIDMPANFDMSEVTNRLVRRDEVINNGALSTKEKAEIPPTPPKGEKEKATTTPTTRVRASEFDDNFLERWGIPKLFVAYWREVTDGQEIKDPKRSIRGYWGRREKDKVWYSFKAAHDKAAEKLKKTYPPEAWELCRECRCCNATATGCAIGVRVPPDHEDQPHPHRPEVCAGFRKQ